VSENAGIWGEKIGVGKRMYERPSHMPYPEEEGVGENLENLPG